MPTETESSTPTDDSAGWHQLLSGQFRRHGDLFLRVAFRIVKDAATAEDVRQQAFLVAAQHQPVESSALKAWLITIVFNLSIEVARRRKTERRAVEGRELNRPEADAPGHEAAALQEAVLAAVEKLPPLPQTVVVLRILEGMSGNETMAVIGCSATEVSRQLRRGLDQLRSLLADQLAGRR